MVGRISSINCIVENLPTEISEASFFLMVQKIQGYYYFFSRDVAKPLLPKTCSLTGAKPVLDFSKKASTLIFRPPCVLPYITAFLAAKEEGLSFFCWGGAWVCSKMFGCGLNVFRVWIFQMIFGSMCKKNKSRMRFVEYHLAVSEAQPSG